MASATLQNGILTINDTTPGNVIRVAQQNGTVQIQGAQFGYRQSAVQEIVVNGKGMARIEMHMTLPLERAAPLFNIIMEHIRSHERGAEDGHSEG